MSDLYGNHERSRETLWANKEDAKALAKLKAKWDAEEQMKTNMAALKEKHPRA